MSLDCIILDFDGTFTDVEAEAVPFLDAYRDELAETFGEPVAARWDEVADLIRREPDGFGWEYDGCIVAPSHADPYILAVSTAQRLLDDHGLLGDLGQRSVFLEALFRSNYPKATSVFRPDARDVVDALVDTGIPVHIVTNSHAEAVAKKLDDLAPRNRDRLVVHGNAQKYVIGAPEPSDARFEALPEALQLEGLDRPVLLRRGRYYEVLREVLAAADADPARTLVCGDIYELDLALPAALGMEVHLVCRPGTPSYERHAVARLPRGAVSEALRPVLARLR
jgi:FMN phosphatase YigB (HAD superfamily)